MLKFWEGDWMKTTQVQKYECNLEEIIEKLQASDSKYEIAEKEFLDKDDDVSNPYKNIFIPHICHFLYTTPFLSL